MNITWDAGMYESGFSFVPAYGEDVMGLLTTEPGARVIDLGCGTGALTKKLAERGYDVLGIDASDDMLARARADHPDLSFAKGDVLDFHLDEPADAIFSNAVMHWIDAARQQEALANIATNLRASGEFVCEFGGSGCAEAVHSTLEQVFAEHGRHYWRTFFFPTIGGYAPLVEAAGMRVEVALLFDRPTPQQDGRTVADWIRMFDTASFEGVPADEADEIIRETEERLRDKLLIDGTWYIDYVRLRLRARKL